MRRALDTLYRARCGLRLLCLVAHRAHGRRAAWRALCSTARSALVHLPRTDFVILSLNEICGYLLAAASFLALAGTLKAGAHIRVTMVLAALSERARRYARNLGLRLCAAALPAT